MHLEPPIAPLAPEDFAILPWGWTPATPEALDGIRRCGFNLAGFVRAEDLDQVAAAGLKGIVFDEQAHVSDETAGLDEPEVRRRVLDLVARVNSHPAAFGYYLRDEPAVAVFAGLARWARAFRDADPAARAYLNLFPNYASPAQLGVESYTAYVQSFLEQVEPPFLSYDHYALMEDGGLRDLYFPNLEIIRAASQRAGLPFWNIVLSNAHFTYAEPSPAGLRFQAYTSLAYGARGISYFTYFAPDSGNYRLAPVDQEGNFTPTWEMLRQVNLQIRRLAPTYLKLRSTHVFHTHAVPAGCAAAESSRLLEEIEGGSFVVGEFETLGGGSYVLVVNKDLLRSAPVTLRFKRKGRLLRTSPYTGLSANVGPEDLWLAPGQGILLGLDES